MLYDTFTPELRLFQYWTFTAKKTLAEYELIITNDLLEEIDSKKE